MENRNEPNGRITVYIAGDSTAANKEADKRPETGWGEAFPALVGPGIMVDNRAMNGRSTRTFIAEGRLDSIASTIRRGDYLFIQFGHNDSKTDSERYTDPETEYPANLLRYVEAARSAGAVPVLLSPVVRRHFDDNGALKDTHGPYLASVKRLAARRGLPLLDMEARTRELLASLGPEASKKLFLHLAPGENPNYPEGIADDTHASPLGAERVAALVADELLRLAPRFPELGPLARAIRETRAG